MDNLSSKLTTAELTELNARVTLQGQDPKSAVAAWLRASGLVN